MSEESLAVQNDYGEPKALGSASATLILILISAALALNVFLFGLDLWIVVKFGVIVAACAFRLSNMTAGIVAGVATMGLDFAIYLFGFYTWPSALIGVIAIYVISTYFTSTVGQNVNGDQNPVYYIVTIIAIRAFLALVYTEVAGIESFSDNILTWITIFVVGIVPDWPILANVILSAVLNGTLLVYLVLLLKRIANPLAN